MLPSSSSCCGLCYDLFDGGKVATFTDDDKLIGRALLKTGLSGSIAGATLDLIEGLFRVTAGVCAKVESLKQTLEREDIELALVED